MLYQWDKTKARANRRKHHVDFADAATVFTDDAALTMPDEEHIEEERFITLGMDALGRILVVSFTWRGEMIRVISARMAESHEREQYEGKL
ncbi:MAG: BrnT family toxin [Chloroflexi bacterium]|nr:BrnT family toxin [Chloroflexota bacterium]